MFRELKWARALRVEVGEELRGWRWSEPPVAPPPVDVRVSVSDVANGYCDSKRAVYLRRVLGVREEPTPPLRFGALVHAVFVKTLVRLRRLIEEGVVRGWELLQHFDAEGLVKSLGGDERALELARFLAVQAAARLDEVSSKFRAEPESLAARVVPVLAEYVVDGRPLGLTVVRADAVAYDVVLEVKVGEEREEHALALAGYALAVEADEEIPVDRGLLVYVKFNGGVRVHARPVAIGEGLRRRFLAERDSLIELIYSGRDPGLASRCLESCPFYKYCHGGGS